MLHSFELSRTVVRLTGKDRAKFLHNFCTADIVGMQPGQVREAMILDAKGKLLGLVHVFCFDDAIEINTVPDQAKGLIQHLDRYIIREDVQLTDTSSSFIHVLVTPPSSGDMSESWTTELFAGLGPCKPFQWMGAFKGEGVRALCALGDFSGRSLLCRFESEVSKDAVSGFLREGTTSLDYPDLNVLTLYRIHARCPWFGIDCDNSNLPQELQRDDTAISFTKGCYLGQETVARIDSLGQVNRLLVAVRSESPGDSPPSGTELIADEKPVGRLTSIATDAHGHWLALSVVRRASAKPETLLSTHSGPARVLQAFRSVDA